MKLTLCILSLAMAGLLAAVVSKLAAGSNTTSKKETSILRRTKEEKKSTTPVDTVDIRLDIDGIKAVSSDDLQLVCDSLLLAYQDWNSAAGSSMELVTVEPQSFAVSDNPDESKLWVLARAGFQVNEHSKLEEAQDRELSTSSLLVQQLLEANGKDGGTSIKDLNEAFCNKLKAVGSKNLATAHNCSFAFLVTPGHSGFRSTQQALVTMRGALPRKLSPQETAALENRVVYTYNSVFKLAGYAMRSFKLVVDVNMQMVEQESSSRGDLLVLAQAVVGRQPVDSTPLDDETYSDGSLVDSQDIRSMESTFYSLLCYLLQTSGTMTFEHVHECNFRFVFEFAH
jgi:hypothetical protein